MQVDAATACHDDTFKARRCRQRGVVWAARRRRARTSGVQLRSGGRVEHDPPSLASAASVSVVPFACIRRRVAGSRGKGSGGGGGASAWAAPASPSRAARRAPPSSGQSRWQKVPSLSHALGAQLPPCRRRRRRRRRLSRPASRTSSAPGLPTFGQPAAAAGRVRAPPPRCRRHRCPPPVSMGVVAAEPWLDGGERVARSGRGRETRAGGLKLTASVPRSVGCDSATYGEPPLL